MENQNEIEFDLMQLLRYLFKRVWIILLATAIFAGAGYVISKKTTVPQYTTSCRVYVYQKEAGYSYNEILVSMYMRNDCEIMITGRNVSERVVDELELNMSANAISAGLKVTSEDDSRVLDISYTDTNPMRAAAILNKVCDVAAEEIENHMNVDAVTTIYSAEVPTTPVATNINRDALLAGAVGMVLAAAILIVLFLMDDTIRNEDDVDRYLGLSTLSAIPVSEELATENKVNDRAKKKGTARFIRK
ncbi:MAG: hypothetical protein IJW14_03790 [Oscillospiraceae bacterium]|nr:hypothetical protein [Oscillospiraceae bacterium]